MWSLKRSLQKMRKMRLFAPGDFISQSSDEVLTLVVWQLSGTLFRPILIVRKQALGEMPFLSFSSRIFGGIRALADRFPRGFQRTSLIFCAPRLLSAGFPIFPYPTEGIGNSARSKTGLTKDRESALKSSWKAWVTFRGRPNTPRPRFRQNLR